ncbi:MAG: uroporphyrinogen-III synthase [Sphingobacterium sp.]|nr:uroporphyrinogen-III synthase [Sphingobacterium sp.]
MGTLGSLAEAALPADPPPGDRRRGARGGAARAPALVRRQAAVRPPGRRHPPARAGAGAGRAARRPGRAGAARADRRAWRRRTTTPSSTPPAPTSATFDWVVLPTLTGAEVFLQRMAAGGIDRQEPEGRRPVRDRPVGRRAASPASGCGSTWRAPSSGPTRSSKPCRRGRACATAASCCCRPRGRATSWRPSCSKAGAEVVEIGAYRTVRVMPGDPGEPDLYKMLLEQQVDVITFTSPSTVVEFVDIHGADAVADVLRTTLVACVGPVTAQAAIALGLMPAIVPEEFTMPAMVAAIVRRLRNRRGPGTVA